MFYLHLLLCIAAVSIYCILIQIRQRSFRCVKFSQNLTILRAGLLCTRDKKNGQCANYKFDYMTIDVPEEALIVIPQNVHCGA